MAEKDLEKLTGIKISHSTLQRLVKRQEFELSTSQQGVKEIIAFLRKMRYNNSSE
jgi:hypothetical protein